MPVVKCPAAEMHHPVLSSNAEDVECRIAGNLRPATSPTTGEVAICCRNYADCHIWQNHKRVRDRNGTVAVGEQMQDQRATHVMGDRDREKLKV